MFKYSGKLFFVVIFFYSKIVCAQDPVFSQFYASSLYLNPSLAGTEHNLTAVAVHRTQWQSIEPYRTNTISCIYPLHRSGIEEVHMGGLGATFINQTAANGNFTLNGGSISAAYNLPIPAYKRKNITFGLQFGFTQKNINNQALQFGSQYNSNIGFYDPSFDSREHIDRAQVIFPNIGAGIMYYHNAGRDYQTKGSSSYIGLAASHLNRPNTSVFGSSEGILPVLWRLHGGMEFHLNESLNLSPNFLFVSQNQQMFEFGKLYQLNAGMYLNYHLNENDKIVSIGKLIVGAWYRLKDSFIFSAGTGNKYFTLGFSFDLNTSQLNILTQGRGAYEVSLKIQKPTINKMRKFHTPLM